MESKVERMSLSAQSWVEEHKLATIGGVWAAAVAYSRRRVPQRATMIHGAVLGGGAVLTHYYNSSRREQMDLDFYSQLPPATDADGNENDRWSRSYWVLVFSSTTRTI